MAAPPHARPALLAAALLIVAVPTRAAEPSVAPRPIDHLIFVIDRDEPSQFIPVRQATIARYSANGINVTTVSQADIDKWVTDKHPDLEHRDEDLEYVRYAQSRRADAIGGIRRYNQNDPDNTQGDPADWPWLINLRRCSRSFALRLEYVRSDSGPVELLDEFDAMRPFFGEQSADSAAPRDPRNPPLGKDLQPRQPFTIYRDYFPDEPLPSQNYPADSDQDVPFIGIRFGTAGTDLLPQRALVGELIPDTPAESAGLKAGDVVLSINGTPTPTRQSLTEQLVKCPLGLGIALEVERDGQTVTLQVHPTTRGEFHAGEVRRRTDLLQSIGEKLAAPQTFKGSDGKPASIPAFDKRLVVVRFIRPVNFSNRPPAWDDQPPRRDSTAYYYDDFVPMIEMTDRSNPNQITWVVINLGEDNPRTRAAATEAMPGARYFVWPDPPSELSRPDTMFAFSPWVIAVYRDGKFLRQIPPSRLPLLLRRLP